MLNFINSKLFWGTENRDECDKIYKFLKQSRIHCTLEEMTGKEAAKKFNGDPYHIYSKVFLEGLEKFYVIRVCRINFKKAVELYEDY